MYAFGLNANKMPFNDFETRKKKNYCKICVINFPQNSETIVRWNKGCYRYTSARVWLLPSESLHTISREDCFIIFLMKRNRCFWFMHEDACTWVSTWISNQPHSLHLAVTQHGSEVTILIFKFRSISISVLKNQYLDFNVNFLVTNVYKFLITAQYYNTGSA